MSPTKTAPPQASKRLFPTKNDLPNQARTQVAETLNQRLADCVDLQSQCKQAHWNVKGPNFIALHKLFDEIDADVENYVDLLAERVVQVGGVAEGTIRMAARRSTLEDYPADIHTGHEHVDALSNALAAFGKVARADIDRMDELGDQASADILTEITRGIDKWLWFVEAHEQVDEVTR